MIVLVGHGFGSDLEVLKFLGVDLETSIVGIFDTAMIRDRVLGPSHDLNYAQLEHLLQKVRCAHYKLHTGGNDANFTLRALLLLEVESYRGSGELLDDAARRRLGIIQSIGHPPLPMRPELPPAAEIPVLGVSVSKKEKRKVRNAAKVEAVKAVRTVEERGQIRAERRAKKPEMVPDDLTS